MSPSLYSSSAEMMHVLYVHVKYKIFSFPAIRGYEDVSAFMITSRIYPSLIQQYLCLYFISNQILSIALKFDLQLMII